MVANTVNHIFSINIFHTTDGFSGFYVFFGVRELILSTCNLQRRTAQKPYFENLSVSLSLSLSYILSLSLSSCLSFFLSLSLSLSLSTNKPFPSPPTLSIVVLLNDSPKHPPPMQLNTKAQTYSVEMNNIYTRHRQLLCVVV